MFGVHELEFKNPEKKIYQVFGSGYNNAYEKVYCQKSFEWHGEI